MCCEPVGSKAIHTGLHTFLSLFLVFFCIPFVFLAQTCRSPPPPRFSQVSTLSCTHKKRTHVSMCQHVCACVFVIGCYSTWQLHLRVPPPRSRCIRRTRLLVAAATSGPTAILACPPILHRFKSECSEFTSSRDAKKRGAAQRWHGCLITMITPAARQLHYEPSDLLAVLQANIQTNWVMTRGFACSPPVQHVEHLRFLPHAHHVLSTLATLTSQYNGPSCS
jgi:hypothetical protein